MANGGFEVDLSGWKPGGTNVSLSRIPGGHSGAYAARITNAGAAPVTSILNDSPNWVSATMPGSYLAGVWGRSNTPGHTLTLRLREYTGSTLVGSAFSTIVLTGAWQPIMVDYAPAYPGISTLDFNMFVSGLPAGASFDVDDATITLH